MQVSQLTTEQAPYICKFSTLPVLEVPMAVTSFQRLNSIFNLAAVGVFQLALEVILPQLLVFASLLQTVAGECALEDSARS